MSNFIQDFKNTSLNCVGPSIVHSIVAILESYEKLYYLPSNLYPVQSADGYLYS